MKKLVALIALLSCVSLSACGGDEVSDDGFRTVHPKGVDCSFELPEPVSNPKRPGYQLWEARARDTGMPIQVGVFPRAFADAEPGASDADILNKFEKVMLKSVQDNLTAGGRPADLLFDGDLPIEDGLGQQVRIISGDEFVFNHFYITPRALYYIKIDNMDETHPIVKRLIGSFEP